MSAQLLRDYQNGDRAPVLGPLTYDECQALVAENARLLAALDKSTRALIEATGETAHV